MEIYFRKYVNYSNQSYLKTKDINNDGIVVVDKDSNKYERDNSGNVTGSTEKLFYYDLNAQDRNNDGSIIAYRDSDRGNFYRDNSGSEVFPTTSDYISQQIDTSSIITQTDVNSAYAPITAQINTLTNAD